MKGQGLWGGILSAVCFALLLIMIGGATASAAPHVFDPVLSLTGDCSVSSLDEVPDLGLCPGTPGIDHPEVPFGNPTAVATDHYGNIYVASAGSESSRGAEGRIDVFDSEGSFITEIADPSGPGSLAVDGDGNLYVANRFNDNEERIVRYSPIGTYKPAAGEIKYSSDAFVIVEESFSSFMAVAVNPANNRLFVKFESRINEYKSAAESPTNSLNEEIGNGAISGDGVGLAVDAIRGRLYASINGAEGSEVQAFELASPHEPLFTIKLPVKTISFLSVAVDEGTGHVFIYDGPAKKVYEFDEDGAYLNNVIEHSFQYVYGSEIAVDNGENSPNGALNPRERYLFVPSLGGSTGHSYAFGPPSEGPPTVESTSFANVGEREAELEASIEPFGLKTHFTFEYLTQQQFEENGSSFAGAQLGGEGDIPAVNAPRHVATTIEGLEPETRYRFRIFVENSEGNDEDEGEFATYPAAEPFPPCSNDPLRTGFSALLADCRAYELVTPPDTNARAPHGVSHFGTYFATRESSPTGGAVSFQIEGGIIPGSEGTGSLGGDPYLSTRGASGWNTASAGPNGAEVSALIPGSTSPDQGYSFWTSTGSGSATIEGEDTKYVRYPDGHSALIGRGSLADDPRADGKLISENGGHIIFVSGLNGPAIQLEPNAPPSGTQAVYDRTVDEVTHVVSLLPGDETPLAGQNATYVGASLDGKGVAFSISNSLYLRYNDEETYELGEGVTFAGIAQGGAKAFYLQGGALWRFDATTEERTEFSSTPVVPVNVAANGNVAYFVSQAVLTGEPNPDGAAAQGGQENLYRSEEGAISFVGTVTERDVEGESNGNEIIGGLGLWTETLDEGQLGADPSRTTPDGDALLFESRAELDSYDPEGSAEVYRYDFTNNELDCLSCNPTLAPASSDASLESISAGLGDPEPFSSFAYVANLRGDGNRAFFQSEEALVPSDVDGLQDVYEWEAKGTGNCNRADGCIYLISSGHSLRTDYLYAASDTGDDVFFRTSDILLPRDAEETPSIYDARVGGGFVEGCPGGQCEPLLPPSSSAASPDLSGPSTHGTGAFGNVRGRACRKGMHRVMRGGKLRCLKKHRHKHHHHHHRKTGPKKKGGRRK